MLSERHTQGRTCVRGSVPRRTLQKGRGMEARVAGGVASASGDPIASTPDGRFQGDSFLHPPPKQNTVHWAQLGTMGEPKKGH